MQEVDREIARAKLTLSLRVLGRRSDGYHTIESEMVTLDLADQLEFAQGTGLELVDEIEWIGARPVDLDAAIAPGRNLVESALLLVRRDARICLKKRIPLGAGLGGGSADAAAVLRWAGESDVDKAARLGADVPFCLAGGHASVGGIGEILEPLPMLDASFVLLVPAIGVSTAAVYAAFDELGRTDAAESSNDLEKASLAVEPLLIRYRDLLHEVSSRRPQLAGSGATWFVECTPDEAIRVCEEARSAIVEAELTAAVCATKTDAGG
ncbi:MAG: 4-(cytidine 5'-diphospho)-2-C-methyl-D-erythritol kinase [Acidimicrobiales bacterium]